MTHHDPTMPQSDEKDANMDERLTHDDETMSKFYAALMESGLDGKVTTDAVSCMQNAGILFRERARVFPPEDAAR